MTNESNIPSDEYLRRYWKSQGGEFFGPNIETGFMAEAKLLPLLRRLLEMDAPAAEPGVVYRKWPGEPPHCMSCDCGMTDEQKRTVPFEDYQSFHTALMTIVHESKSFTEAVRLASDALQRKPAEPASREAPSAPIVCRQCGSTDTMPWPQSPAKSSAGETFPGEK
jgi:hypothetical protein